MAAWAQLAQLATSAELVNLEPGDCVPCEAVARVAPDPRSGRGHGHGWGLGTGEDEALAAACGEAVERNFSGALREETRHRSRAKLGGEALDPLELVLYRRKRFVVRPQLAPYDASEAITWTEGRWLDSGEAVWVPALLAHFGYMPPRNERFCVSTTNGLAAGIDFASAVRNAVLELVERDAFMITWLARLPAQRLGEDDSLPSAIQQVIERMRSLGAEVEMYLLDAGLDIPVVACVAFGDGSGWPGAVVGCGAAFSATDAAQRAILEVGGMGPQLRRLLQLGHEPRPELMGPRDPIDHAMHYTPAARASSFAFMRRPVTHAIPLGDMPPFPFPSLEAWTAAARQKDVRILVADVTSPTVTHTPWRVVRALGTHTQPLDFGYRFQRLDNPRLDRFLAGSAPNPDPHPLN